MKLETSRAYNPIGQRAAGEQHLPRCEQCNGLLGLPEWSEQVNVRCMRYLWACDACGYRFESWVYGARS
jgi:hypothetical protein